MSRTVELLAWMGLAGFLIVVLVSSRLLLSLDVAESRDELRRACAAYQESVDALSPVSDMTKFMAYSDEAPRP